MAGDELTPSENAILIVLMAEAREVLNTELRETYGLDVRKPARDKLGRKGYAVSRKNGRTFALELGDKGWVHVQEQLNFRSNGATAQAAALTALLNGLRSRVLDRSGCTSFAELFALTDVRGSASAPEQGQVLRTRIVNAYDALTDEPGGWVSLTRLRRFFGDVPRADLDEALRRVSREPGVTLAPQSNQKVLTDTDHAAALHIGGQDKHVLSIGV
ncbi:hypothetical protein AMIS_12490 [Actinoplanes missouriensis 431]|uniref:Uncharacterized protein n=1 Tax=Actinoplanes missouriensis (strain ATCC 14538 / DSM 43046 / CBS 188.64 / JCM 3121 / NBRC 102363 / NCIMB 12654 / NRRL B-3342 / UNCC 431) TaxID=512565 RepID=I0H0D2_ACTM4|nr:hypothetical protein [Actinoplanes missouriensis]BAL86469.1 hypothetical protein AMIS_12490 [Actinoplanes missouriensis 431]